MDLSQSAALLALGMLVITTGAMTAFPADPPPAHARPAPVGTSVMSFNVRYGSADDGVDAWPKRKAMLFDVLRRHDPDLVGMQEVLDFQADELKAQFPDYGFAGVGREDGKRKGEFAPIFFRADRFVLLDGGTFWLSETPEKVASVGWDSSLTRIATWVKLRDRRDGDRTVLFLNTHWDHRGDRARRESADLIRRKLPELADGTSAVLLTGDFNTSEDDPAYRTLTADNTRPLRLIDAYRAAHPARAEQEATFHAFKGTVNGSRIDFILHSSAYTAASARIDRTNDSGRYPSDHYPVVVEFISNAMGK